METYLPLSSLYNFRIEIKDIISIDNFIYFKRGEDILFSLTFLNDRVIINNFIEGSSMKNPPSFRIDVKYLRELEFNYNFMISQINIKCILKENCIYKTLYLEKFEYNLIITKNIVISLLENVKINYIKDFINKLEKNNILDFLIDNIENKNISRELLFDTINDIIKKKKKDKTNNLLKIEQSINNIMTKVLNENEKKKLINSNKEFSLIFSLEKEIYIYRNGTIKINNKKGNWYNLKQNIVFFLDGFFFLLNKVNNNLYDPVTKSIWFYDDNFNNIISLDMAYQSTIILIISCQSRIKRVNILRNLWVKQLREFGYKCFFVIGNNYTKETTIINDIIWTNCNDYYEGLPEKIYESLHFIENNFNYKYVYKIDDDCILNPLRFIRSKLTENYIGIPKSIDRNFNRFWHKGKCNDKNKEKIPYPSSRIFINTFHAKGESGYFLSKIAIRNILSKKKYIITDLYEDKVIGDVLRLNNIILTKNDLYLPKLFHKSLLYKNIDINKFTIIVDIPEGSLKNIYDKFIKIKSN